MSTKIFNAVRDFCLHPTTRLPIDFPFGFKRGAKLYFKSLLYYIAGNLLPLGLFMLFLAAGPLMPAPMVAYMSNENNLGTIIAIVAASGFICGFGLQISVFRTALHAEGKRLRDVLGLNLNTMGTSGGARLKIFAAGLATFLIAVGLEQGIAALYPLKINDPTADFMGLLKGTGLVLMCAIALLAPVVEEIVFRGFIFRITRAKLRAHSSLAAHGGVADLIAILFSATIFGLMHMNLPALPMYIALGAVFAEAYRRTGCLYVPMVAHFLNNGLIVAALLIK